MLLRFNFNNKACDKNKVVFIYQNLLFIYLKRCFISSYSLDVSKWFSIPILFHSNMLVNAYTGSSRVLFLLYNVRFDFIWLFPTLRIILEHSLSIKRRFFLQGFKRQRFFKRPIYSNYLQRVVKS